MRSTSQHPTDRRGGTPSRIQATSLNRLTNTTSKDVSGEAHASFTYHLNTAGQRVRMDVSGANYRQSAYWEFTYDSLGQEVNGSDHSPVRLYRWMRS